MASSPELISDSPKNFVNPEEQSGFDTSPDSHTDPAQDNSSEEYTDSDDDPNPGIAAGGCYVVDMENGDPDIVKKARAGIQAAIDDFNHRHGSSYQLVEIQEVIKAVCMGYAFDLSFAAKPANSADNLLTEFKALVWFVPVPPDYDYELRTVKCEANSTKRATEAVLDSQCSKRQREC